MRKHYKYENDFDLPTNTHMLDKYPSGIKRIISQNQHTFHKRFYFFNESHWEVYNLGSDPMRYQVKWNSHVYCIFDNMNKWDALYVNDRLMAHASNIWVRLNWSRFIIIEID